MLKYGKIKYANAPAVLPNAIAQTKSSRPFLSDALRMKTGTTSRTSAIETAMAPTKTPTPKDGIIEIIPSGIFEIKSHC